MAINIWTEIVVTYFEFISKLGLRTINASIWEVGRKNYTFATSIVYILQIATWQPSPDLWSFTTFFACNIIWLWYIKYCLRKPMPLPTFWVLNGLCVVVVKKEIKGLVHRSVKSCSQRKNYNKLNTFDGISYEENSWMITISDLKGQ